MKKTLVLSLLVGVVYGAPKLRIYPKQAPPQLLTLPSNATSIRLDITDSFSCEGREYGYYADIENDCQIFHVCLPVRYSDGRNQTFRWSFICPDDTIFNQEIFTCTNADESIDCMESPRFYMLNSHFGDDQDTMEVGQQPQIEDGTVVPEDVNQGLEKMGRRPSYETKRKALETTY
ncbi:hypothetical protein ILUMI_01972 [Ignelater luminosus]|uniref:Chitin-binding type-2 domain-containing protein n=1 Tax=Ignelater luminosus TaxID=2038154 RepID=A0A8K0DJ73_IGNLU|nr:hypothetical protein ILUMI_01972 [Ignelater luminosus]